MKLGEYLSANSVSDAAFAIRVGVSRSMITKLRHGTARPSAETAFAIEIATAQTVMLSDLMPAGSSGHVIKTNAGAAA